MKTLLLLLLLSTTGCVLYRHDVDTAPDGTTRDSMTGLTLMKDFIIIVEPNSVEYNSTANRVKVVTPYGIGETN